MVSNVWAKFQSMLPKPTRRIGAINLNLGNDLYRVLLPDGGVIEARSSSTYSLGESVFVEDDKIIGRASDLPTVTIEV